jgi:hypothetical protein
MATISNTPRPGYVWDSTDNVWYPIGTGPHTHADYITSGSAINPNIVDAKGDIIAATAADTVSRLAVGANDTVLTADSSTATGLKWAAPVSGGITLISTTTLSGATTTLSSIPQTYVSLYLVVTGVTGNTGNAQVRILPNNVTNLTAYSFVEGGAANATSTSQLRLSDASTLRTSADNAWAVQIHNYTSSTNFKPFSVSGYFLNSSSANAPMFSGGAFRSNTAITSLVLDYGGTNTFAGGTVLLYGVK